MWIIICAKKQVIYTLKICSSFFSVDYCMQKGVKREGKICIVRMKWQKLIKIENKIGGIEIKRLWIKKVGCVYTIQSTGLMK